MKYMAKKMQLTLIGNACGWSWWKFKRAAYLNSQGFVFISLLYCMAGVTFAQACLALIFVHNSISSLIYQQDSSWDNRSNLNCLYCTALIKLWSLFTTELACCVWWKAYLPALQQSWNHKAVWLVNSYLFHTCNVTIQSKEDDGYLPE